MQQFLVVAVVLGLLSLASTHTGPEVDPIKHHAPHPQPGGGGGGHGGGGHGGGGHGGGGIIGGGGGGSCPRPSAQSLRCLQEWACQHVIRLDLRCLLNLNGNNLLGNLVSIPGLVGGGSTGGGGAGGSGGGGGGILGGLLGK